MTPPTLSVVIPTFNRRASLTEALESVRAQTVPPKEILVVDDGSTDGTADADLGPGVTLIPQENRGPAAARNRGIREATGDWIAFLDSDDRWAPTKLATQAALVDEETVLCYAREQGQDSDGKPLHIRPEKTPDGEALGDLVKGNFVPTSTVIARRDAILEVGGFDEEMTHSEDWDLWLRLAERGRFAASTEVLSFYRFHEDQLISDRQAMSLGRLRVLEKLAERQGRDPVLGPVIRKKLFDRKVRQVRRYAKHGYLKEAGELARTLPLLSAAGIRARLLLFSHGLRS
jgi:glycosyltransferase involved in cell wall biosynthesis